MNMKDDPRLTVLTIGLIEMLIGKTLDHQIRAIPKVEGVARVGLGDCSEAGEPQRQML
jgi:hypothetical protein